MKITKKLISLLLTAIMIGLMATTAFADPAPYSITVTNDADHVSDGMSINGKTYSAYKLFDVTYAVDTQGAPTGAYSYTLASEFDGFTYTLKDDNDQTIASYSKTNLQDWLDYLEGISNNSAELDAFAAAVLKYAGDNNIAAKGSAVAANETATIELQEAGYYLVGGTATAPDNQTITAACALTTTDPTATVQVKANAPTIDKVIVTADSNNGGEGKGTAQDVGSVVNFKVTTEIPDMTGYTSYSYVVTDTLSAGLTGVDADSDGKIDVAVKVNGVDYPAVSGTTTNYTVSATGTDGKFTITFDNILSLQAQKGQKIDITYGATINNAALTTDVETNTVNLEYSNNPYDNSTKGKTPDKTVYVYDFDIVIDKFAEDQTEANTDNERLADATFVLYKTVDGTKQYYKVDATTKAVSWVALPTGTTPKAAAEAGTITSVTTDSTGAASFTGIQEGTYNLQEIAAPAGYNMLTSDPQVVITNTYNTDGTIATTTATSENNGQYKQTAQIENSTGIRLPSTGGIGTTIFYVVGAILVVGAAVVLVTRRVEK